MLSATIRAPRAATSTRALSSAALASAPIQITQAAAGLRVATANLPSAHQVASEHATSLVSLVVKAGPRYETADNAGVAHFLKRFAFRNTRHRTAFRTIREAELQGGQLSASLGREYQIYTVRCLPVDVPYFTEVLSSVALETNYADYEFRDIKAEVANESLAGRAQPEIRVFDELHRAAFHNGLGNSLYAPAHHEVTHSKLVDFAQRAFQPAQMGLVGVNVDHQQLEQLGNELFKTGSAAVPSGLTTSASQYVGGEVLLEGPHDATQYVLAYPGAATSEAWATSQVLTHLLGSSVAPSVKYGVGHTPLAAAAQRVGHGVTLEPFAFTYSDAGLLGVRITTPQASGHGIAEGAKAAAETLQKVASSAPTGEALSRAVKQASFAAAVAQESAEAQTDLLHNLVFTSQAGTTLSAADTFKALQSVSAKDVQAIAEKMLKQKPTAVGIGNVQALPRVDTL
ncbi:ubiquinol-cytochrome c reductase core subunit 1 [Tieghemiomyces parasiticus]|uniref:Cytochrome b-c1 complex subunit 2, mitochondrial n=1 Tax=Tieghemiomyces parasiticus TaxID=78921 RepID=A0A9W8AAL7_9FUNG|nr:ubiquinol-cytochrome c reductase core subunit 1 [Tieghemiomyces parasiticus]